MDPLSVEEMNRQILTLRAEVARLTNLVNSIDADNAKSNEAALELLREALGTCDVHGVLEGIERLKEAQATGGWINLQPMATAPRDGGEVGSWSRRRCLPRLAQHLLYRQCKFTEMTTTI